MSTTAVVLNQGSRAKSANKKRVLSPQPLFDSTALLAYFAEAGLKERHATRMVRQLIRGRNCGIMDVPDLPKACYAELPQRFAVTTSTPTASSPPAS